MIARSVLSLLVTTILLFPVVGLADALPKGIIKLDGRQAPALKLDEAEGGNFILPRTGNPVAIRAQFLTGADKTGPVIDIKIDDVHCAEDPAS